MSTTDQINLMIAVCTGLAAVGSLLAAGVASSSARKSSQSAEKAAAEEKDRWLTNLLYSLANQCNECVTTSGGIIMPTQANISRLITILCNSIDLIDRESGNESKSKHLYNLWIFLHSSIWIEIEKRHALSSISTFSPQDKHVIVMQYEKVRCQLLLKIKP